MSRIVCLDCGHVHECDTKKSSFPSLPPTTGPYINTYPPYTTNPAGGTLTVSGGGGSQTIYNVTGGTGQPKTHYEFTGKDENGNCTMTNCCEPKDSIDSSE